MTTLDVRYGRTKQRRRRGILIAIIAGASIALVMGLWVAWAGVGDSSAMVESRTVARETLNDHEMQVTFEVSTHGEVGVDCAVLVVNDMNSPVGWTIVPVATDEQRTQVESVVVTTSEPPANGMVYRCWIP
ncbi:DUF4307 domain-containing protein [uncultured Agrococcus sp.]|uniref:DUF4307 domain-containing protein n=1 Tax=uncultured Agrococcus sp. TaxID=382258 RepID=UPI0025D04187|nr:DUF4307 domain-containing protein [uncultured Agrococcus sp.]